MKKINIFEAFSGIGAQRKALENIKKKNWSYNFIGQAEWYIPAIIAYEAIHNNFNINKVNQNVSKDKIIDYLQNLPLSMDSKTLVKQNYWKKIKINKLKLIYFAVKESQSKGNIFDVKNLFKFNLKNVDLLTYSFPCQDISQQGKQKGMSENSNSKSSLVWQVYKALKNTKKNDLPKVLLMENVKSLLNKKNKLEFEKWQECLKKLGYNNNIKLLNSNKFGSSQARERVFMISSLKGKINIEDGRLKPQSIKKILNKKVNDNDYLNNLTKYKLSEFKKTKSNIKKAKLLNYTTFNSEAYVYDINYSGPTLTATGANSRIKILFNNKIRKLNSEEAFRYMGFETEDFQKVNNLLFLNHQKLIFLCGNSISIHVLEPIMKVITKYFKNM